jgi:alpha-glucosidase
VYLPAGSWYDFHTNAPVQGGTWLRGVPLYRDSLFRLPLYARAGAILPRMHVDEQTMNVLGRRSDRSTRDELIARVYPHTQATSFTLYEDDGETIAYLDGALATTAISQRRVGGRTVVHIGARQGSYEGARSRRDNVVELVAGRGGVRAVRVNGTALTRRATRQELDGAGTGWMDAGDGVVIARSGEMPVDAPTRFEFEPSR